MKIDPTRPASTAAPGRRTGGADGAGFTLPTGETPRAASAAGVSATAAVGGLLALQMDDATRRKRQTRRASAALDALDRLQAGLLSGAAGDADARDLADRLGEREPTGDDRLDDVLREIDVRAAVELAKRERRGAGRA